ncbi:hypothetical protein [Ulvibacterium sp.]|uniref:hypothetical protein n=1 Tax=Ulvibacterium sp. TaxID=2665914 RepID=UPI003BA9531F
MKDYLKKTPWAFIVLIIVSCSSKGSGSDDGMEPEPSQGTEEPASFSLLFPHNNEVCLEGALVADEPTQLLINAKWEDSLHATEYDVSVIDSKTGEEVTHITTANTNTDMALTKGTLYQWSVTAINKDKIKKSVQWSFYTRGEGLGNHVPYPAHNISFYTNPSNEILTVEWEAADEDNDVLTFDVKVFENDLEIDSYLNLEEPSIDITDSVPGAKYYLVITVSDGASETTTDSPVFEHN